jgi:hypothetical protein
MAIRWFWYVSRPKLKQFEDQGTSRFIRFTRQLKLSLELSVANLKACVTHDAPIPSGLVKRLDLVEKKLRTSSSLCSVSEILAGKRPVFFEFRGLASKYIQAGFEHKKPREQSGEDYYPSGAFVVAGFAPKIAVVLVGSAANMYGSPDNRIQISKESHSPIAFINGLAGGRNPGGVASLLSSLKTAYNRCNGHDYCKVRAVAVFGACVRLNTNPPLSQGLEVPDEALDHGEDWRYAEHLIVGSPVFVEQLPWGGALGNGTGEGLERRRG